MVGSLSLIQDDLHLDLSLVGINQGLGNWSGGEAVGLDLHGGSGFVQFPDDDILGEPDGETGGDDGVGSVVQVICIYPYVPPQDSQQ